MQPEDILFLPGANMLDGDYTPCGVVALTSHISLRSGYPGPTSMHPMLFGYFSTLWKDRCRREFQSTEHVSRSLIHAVLAFC